MHFKMLSSRFVHFVQVSKYWYIIKVTQENNTICRLIYNLYFETYSKLLFLYGGKQVSVNSSIWYKSPGIHQMDLFN